MGLFKIAKTLLDSVTKIFTGKQEVDKKKIEHSTTVDNNQTEVKKSEIVSEDALVRRNRYIILLICVGVIVAEAFGIRLAILNKLGIDPNLINFDKVLILFSDILASAFLGA